jgi:hypothetical protein
VPKAAATGSRGPALAAKPALFADGDPQIAKACGNAPCRPTSRPCWAGKATSGGTMLRFGGQTRASASGREPKPSRS